MRAHRALWIALVVPLLACPQRGDRTESPSAASEAAAEPEGPPLSGRFGDRLHAIEQPLRLPDYVFVDGRGHEIGFNEMRGRVVLATFWAPWCGICARELPKLDRLAGELRGAGLRVALLGRDASSERLAQDLRERGLHYAESYLDVGNVNAAALGVNGVPTTFVADRNGWIVGAVRGGADWDSPEAEAYLRYYLDGPP